MEQNNIIGAIILLSTAFMGFAFAVIYLILDYLKDKNNKNK
jgi:preprotein translocase subunit SecG